MSTTRVLRVALAVAAYLLPVVWAGVAPASSATTPSGFVTSPGTVHAARTVTLRVQVDMDTECHLSAAGIEQDVAARDPAIFRLSWRTPKRMRSARYSLLLSCGDPGSDDHVQRVLRVRGVGVTRGGTKRLAATELRVRVETVLPIDVEAYVVGYWEERREVLALDDGSCTQWVFGKRPDIVEAAEKANVRRWLANGRAGGLNVLNWNANEWAANAVLAGLPVTGIPRVGAVEVSPEGTDSPNGHVAYVERVNADGSYTVSEWGVNGTTSQTFVTTHAPEVLGGQILGYGHHVFVG